MVKVRPVRAVQFAYSSFLADMPPNLRRESAPIGKSANVRRPGKSPNGRDAFCGNAVRAFPLAYPAFPIGPGHAIAGTQPKPFVPANCSLRRFCTRVSPFPQPFSVFQFVESRQLFGYTVQPRDTKGQRFPVYFLVGCAMFFDKAETSLLKNCLCVGLFA